MAFSNHHTPPDPSRNSHSIAAPEFAALDNSHMYITKLLSLIWWETTVAVLSTSSQFAWFLYLWRIIKSLWYFVGAWCVRCGTHITVIICKGIGKINSSGCHIPAPIRLAWFELDVFDWTLPQSYLDIILFQNIFWKHYHSIVHEIEMKWV